MSNIQIKGAPWRSIASLFQAISQIRGGVTCHLVIEKNDFL
jgi:hypothetical protein